MDGREEQSCPPLARASPDDTAAPRCRISAQRGLPAPALSPLSGTLNGSRVPTKYCTLLFQSDSLIFRPVCAVFMSRPVYLQGPPLATHRKSITCWRTRVLESSLKPTKNRPSWGSLASPVRNSSVTSARVSYPLRR